MMILKIVYFISLHVKISVAGIFVKFSKYVTQKLNYQSYIPIYGFKMWHSVTTVFTGSYFKSMHLAAVMILF